MINIDFYLFGTHFNNGFVFSLGIIYVLGLFMGWFMRKGNIFWCFVAILVFAPLLESIAERDDFFITAVFTLGFLTHTAKPIYRRLTK